MNPNLEKAIIEFLANEFQLPPESILLDSDLIADFNLNPDQVTDLLTRLQDALNFILPEDKISQIHTVADLFASLQPEEAPHESF